MSLASIIFFICNSKSFPYSSQPNCVLLKLITKNAPGARFIVCFAPCKSNCIFFNCIKCYCIIVIVVYISFVLLAICYCSAVLTALFGFRSPPPPIPLPWHCGLVVPILTSVTQPLDLLCGLYTSTSKR